MKKQSEETPVWKRLRDVGVLVMFWSIGFLPLEKAFWGLTEFAVGFYSGLGLLLLGLFLGVRSYVSRRNEALSEAGSAAEPAPDADPAAAAAAEPAPAPPQAAP